MTSVITVTIYVYGSSVVLFSSSKRYSQTRGGTLWSMQWDFFCPLLMHNSSNTIWPQHSLPAAALSRWILHQLDVLDPTALHLRSTEGSEEGAGTLQGPWQFWAPQQPGSSTDSQKQNSAPHVIWLWQNTDLFLMQKLKWQQKSGERMNNFEKIFNLTFTVNNLETKAWDQGGTSCKSLKLWQRSPNRLCQNTHLDMSIKRAGGHF